MRRHPAFHISPLNFKIRLVKTCLLFPKRATAASAKILASRLLFSVFVNGAVRLDHPLTADEPGQAHRYHTLSSERLHHPHHRAIERQGQVCACVCSKSLISFVSMLRYCSQNEPTSWLVPST